MPAPQSLHWIDCCSVVEAVPGLNLILLPDFTIVGASDAYLDATMTKREEIMGRNLFEVFPDSPDEPMADGVANLRASLNRVLENRRADSMPIQRYPIRRPEEAGGGFEERYWSPINVPVFREGELVYIVHRVEDVTGFIRLQEQSANASKAAETAQARADEMAAEIMAQSERLSKSQAQLQEAYDALRVDFEREREVVRILQQPLKFRVPEHAYPGLRIAAVYSAAPDEDYVGGDFYDVVPLMDGRIAFVLGDVCGHGIETAARAREVKDVLQAFLRTYPAYPAATLTRLSDYLVEERELGGRDLWCTFVAISLAIALPDRSVIQFARAGMESPTIIRADGKIEHVEGGGLPVGILPHQVYSDVAVRIEPGETVVLTTDGLTEARRDGEVLWREGVDELVQRAMAEPDLYAMGEAILAGARDYSGGQLTDDACLLLLRRQ